MSKRNRIYELLEELGGEDIASKSVLAELIQWLTTDQLVEFVDDFRSLHDMKSVN